MATHCSVLTQEVPWAEELGRLLAMKPPGGRRGSVATQQAGLHPRGAQLPLASGCLERAGWSPRGGAPSLLFSW